MIWGSTAILRPLVLVVVTRLSHTTPQFKLIDLLVTQVVLGAAVILVLWGLGRLMRDARALQPDLMRLTKAKSPRDAVPEAASVTGPVVLSAADVMFTNAGIWVHSGMAVAVTDLPLSLINVLPIMTFVWTYLTLLVDLDRIGRSRLALDPFPHDRNLGLSPVGALAFFSFWVLLAAALPILLLGDRDTTSLIVSLLIVLVTVPIFFLSMWRLHRQMAQAKAKYIAQARDLYAAAYEPLRLNSTVEMLQR